MAAEISFKDGKAEALTTLKPAWWDGTGEYCADHFLTSEEIYGERGLLNWQVELRKVFDEAGQEIAGYFRSVRTDTNATLGIVGEKYKVVQNKTAFNFMDGLMKDGIMKYASCGALKGGRRVWVLAVNPDEDEIVPGDKQRRYTLWTSSHDGSGAIYCFPTSVRVECWNTLTLAFGERNKAVGIRHSGDVFAKLQDARKILLDADQRFVKYNADARKLAATTFTRQQAQDFINELFPPVENDGRSKSIRERKVQAVRDAMRDASNNLPDMKGTFWQLLNAVTFAVDHGEVIAFRGKGRDRQDNRMISLMTGDGMGATLKREAFDLALSMAN